MKKVITTTAMLSLIVLTHAQIVPPLGNVGINTANPQRNLHVEGDLLVSKITDRSESGTYSNILVTNSSGDIDHVLRDDFLPTPDSNTSNKEVFNSIYNENTNTANPSKSVACGKFVFLFEQDTTDPNPLNHQTDFRFKLKEAPTSTVEINVSMEQNWNGSGFQFYQGTTPGGNQSFTFDLTPTSANYWNTPHDFASSNVADYEQNIIHLQYPGDPAFYRLNIYKVKQANSWDFVTVCEKF